MLNEELKKEIEKWTQKLDNRLPEVSPSDKAGEEILENAGAYREDSEHFQEEGDLIKSFESLIWAWAFVEIGERFNHLNSSEEE